MGDSGNINVDLLSRLAVAGDTAEEEVVAAGCDGDGVVAGSVSGLGGGGVAGFVVSMRHVHHIMELCIVFEI